MDYRKIIDKLRNALKDHPIHSLLFINLIIGYATLFIIFMVVLVDCCYSHKTSDWVLENFSPSFEKETLESKTTHAFYSKLLAQQEPLGKEFEKVLNENLWDLYES